MKVDWKARFKALQREVREERETATQALAYCQVVEKYIKAMDFGLAARCNDEAIGWLLKITDKEAANGN